MQGAVGQTDMEVVKETVVESTSIRRDSVERCSRQ